MKQPTIESLREQAKQHYPNSDYMQEAWVEKTLALYQSNKHAFQTGGWNREGFKYECI